jgi:hypothetical protein
MSVPAETIGLQDRMRPFIGVGNGVCKGSQRAKPAFDRRTLPLPGPTAADKQKQRAVGGAWSGFCVGWIDDHGVKLAEMGAVCNGKHSILLLQTTLPIYRDHLTIRLTLFFERV